MAFWGTVKNILLWFWGLFFIFLGVIVSIGIAGASLGFTISSREAPPVDIQIVVIAIVLILAGLLMIPVTGRYLLTWPILRNLRLQEQPLNKNYTKTNKTALYMVIAVIVVGLATYYLIWPLGSAFDWPPWVRIAFVVFLLLVTFGKLQTDNDKYEANRKIVQSKKL